jgi:hypothetical protein
MKRCNTLLHIEEIRQREVLRSLTRIVVDMRITFVVALSEGFHDSIDLLSFTRQNERE